MPQSKLLFVVLVITALHNVSAQSPDTLFVASSREKSVKAYELATVVQSGLFNGGAYIEPKRTNDEHPFFLTEEWQEGAVEYKGQAYKKLTLLYDLTTDRLVTELFNGQPFVLVGEHLDNFRLAGRNFIKAEATPGNGLPTSGYYELAYGGNTKVLVRHFKVAEERIEGNTLQIHFTLKTRFYVLRNGVYVRISGKSGLLKTLKDQRSELRSYISERKLNFSSGSMSSALAEVAAYYDTLKPIVN